MAGCYEHDDGPSGSIKGGNFFTSWMAISFSRRTLFHGVGWFVAPPKYMKLVSLCLTFRRQECPSPRLYTLSKQKHFLPYENHFPWNVSSRSKFQNTWMRILFDTVCTSFHN